MEFWASPALGFLTGLFCFGVPRPWATSPASSLVLAQEDAASPLAVLEELTLGDCRQDLATKLVKLFLGQGQASPLLDYLTRREVTRTSELLLRLARTGLQRVCGRKMGGFRQGSCECV